MQYIPHIEGNEEKKSNKLSVMEKCDILKILTRGGGVPKGGGGGNSNPGVLYDTV